MKNKSIDKVIAFRSGLLCVIIILAGIYVCQLLFTGKSKIKTVHLQGEINKISVNVSGETLVVEKKDKWVVGKNQFAADADEVEKLINAIKEIRVLGTVSKNSSDAERYGLNPESALIVTAYDGEKILTEFNVGKNNSTNSQAYIQLNGKQEILLAQGALHSIFTASEDKIRSNSVYDFDTNLVSMVKVTNSETTYAIARNNVSLNEDGLGNAKWVLAEGNLRGGILDDSKIDSWINAMSSLEVESWLSENDPLTSGTPRAVCEIQCGGKTYSVSLYDGTDKVNAVSSDSKYSFVLSKIDAARFEKPQGELCK